MRRTQQPPMAFGMNSMSDAAPNPLNTAPLIVYFLEHEGVRYWVFDRHGFICAVTTHEELDELLLAEKNGSAHHEGKALKYYWAGARELVYPGDALRRAQASERYYNSEEFARLRAPGPTKSERKAERRGAASATAGLDLLADLGIEL